MKESEYQETIHYDDLSETAQSKIVSMLSGAENHQIAVAKPYGSGHQVDTVSRDTREESLHNSGWYLVKYE